MATPSERTPLMNALNDLGDSIDEQFAVAEDTSGEVLVAMFQNPDKRLQNITTIQGIGKTVLGRTLQVYRTVYEAGNYPDTVVTQIRVHVPEDGCIPHPSPGQEGLVTAGIRKALYVYSEAADPNQKFSAIPRLRMLLASPLSSDTDPLIAVSTGIETCRWLGETVAIDGEWIPAEKIQEPRLIVA